jgi:hypothetical protein
MMGQEVPSGLEGKRVIAEGFVLRVIREFVDFSHSLCGEDPHIVLALFWLEWKRKQGLWLGDDALHRRALPETKMISCVEPGDCPEALALQLLADEHPSSYGALPLLQKRLVALLSPALDASIAGRYQDLYVERNPVMAGLMRRMT